LRSVRRRLRRVKLEIPIEDMPTTKAPAIKFIEDINTGFTCSAETERVPAINTDQTEYGPVCTEEDVMRRAFRSMR